MKSAVLVETSRGNGLNGLLRQRNAAELPVVNRFLVDCWMETLAEAGVRSVIIALASDGLNKKERVAEVVRMRRYVDQGGRWGIPAEVVSQHDWVRGVAFESQLSLDLLVWPEKAGVAEILAAGSSVQRWDDHRGQAVAWWAGGTRGAPVVPSSARAASGLLRMSSARDYADVVWEVLASMNQRMNPERDLGDGLWVSSQTHIHRTVQVDRPAYIGPLVALSSGVVIGANCVLGDGVLLDEGAKISESMIMPGTYVGAYLDLHRKIADNGYMIDIDNGAAVEITDPGMMGALAFKGDNRPIRTAQDQAGREKSGLAN